MARVNVEQQALSDHTDPRYKSLGRALGVDRWSALGRMTAVWNLCQERETYVLDAETLNNLFDDAPCFSDALLKSGLGKRHRFGVYVCGSKGRIEWLANKRHAGRENGKKGGRPPKTEQEPSNNQDGLRVETPPAPALPLTRNKGFLSGSQANADTPQEIHPGLQQAARFWNDSIAPAWGKPAVTVKTLRQLGTKFASLEKTMRADHPDWTLVAALKKAFETLPGLRSESWFVFREFLFEHNYHQKNERLWTGYYASTCGQSRKADGPPRFTA